MRRVLRNLICLCMFPAAVLAGDAARATSSSVEVPAEAAPGMVVHLDDKACIGGTGTNTLKSCP